MPETVLERHYRDRVESLRQLATTGNGSWRDHEDMLAICVELAASGRNLLEQEYRRAFKEPEPTVAWLRERRRVMVELSDSYIALAQTVKAAATTALAAAAHAPGSDVVGKLDTAIAAVVAAKRDWLERWPVGSDEEIAAAHAAAARGEGLDLDDAFAQIAGVDTATWRRRIGASRLEAP